MSVVIDRIQNNTIYNEMEVSFETLRQVQDMPNLSEEEKDYLTRFEQVFVFVQPFLEHIDPVFSSLRIVNAIKQALTNFNSTLNVFLQNHQIQRLIEADQRIDDILQSIPLLSMPVNDPGIIEGITQSFRRSLGQHNRRLEDEINELSRQKNELSHEIQELKASIFQEKERLSDISNQGQSMLSNFQHQFSGAQDKRMNDFNNERNERSKVFDEAEKERKLSYEEAARELQRHQNSWVKKLETEYTNLTNGLSTEYKSMTEGFRTTAMEATKEIEDQRDYVKELVGLIANTGQARGYQVVANEEHNSAQLWRWITLASMLFFTIFAVYTFIIHTGLVHAGASTTSWSSIGTHLFITLAFGGLSGYAGKQASDHQKAERWNRRMALELSSIDPYLASLDESAQRKVKESLASKLFGQAEVAVTSQNIEESDNITSLGNSNLTALLVKVLEQVLQEQIKSTK